MAANAFVPPTGGGASAFAAVAAATTRTPQCLHVVTSTRPLPRLGGAAAARRRLGLIRRPAMNAPLRMLSDDSSSPSGGDGVIATTATAEASGDGATVPHTPAPRPPPPAELPTVRRRMEFKPITSPLRRLARSLRLLFSVRSRVKKGAVLCLKVGGAMPDQAPPRLFLQPPSPQPSLPEVLQNLRNAAHDPRVAAVYMTIEPLACGYAKLEEIRRHLDYFRQSGKPVVAFLQLGGVKEYYVSLSADEVYAPPEAFLSLRGFRVSGSFVRGVLDKIGIEPQVERIGVYKSAGDQLSRTSMSDAQRRVLETLLNAAKDHFIRDVSESRKREPAEVDELLNRAPQRAEEYKNGRWITDVKYETEVLDLLKLRYNKGGKDEAKLKRKLMSVSSRKYSRVTAKKLALGGRARVAILRASGAITLGKNGSNPVLGSTVGSESFVELVRNAANLDNIKAVVLRIDSPGGVSLAADVMWKELRKLAAKKPVIASMADVAASGGYYIAMACDRIVAEQTTITGSIGVVSTKLSLGELYRRIGFRRENMSSNRYAEFDVDNRAFTDDERRYFAEGAEQAYTSFVSKAAESRGMSYDDMQAVAQGRVWTGQQAREQKLVDELGGLAHAVELAKEKANISDPFVNLVELRAKPGLPGVLGLLGFGGGDGDSAELNISLQELGLTHTLTMAEYDGSEMNPVIGYLLGKVVQAFNAAGVGRQLAGEVLSELLGRR